MGLSFWIKKIEHRQPRSDFKWTFKNFVPYKNPKLPLFSISNLWKKQTDRLLKIEMKLVHFGKETEVKGL